MAMKRRWLYIALTILLIFANRINGQDVTVDRIKIPELERILSSKEDVLHVVNFWATWCGPCVREFPTFEKVARDYGDKKVKFIMISLDFPSQVEKQLIPFLEKNKSELDVAVMMDVDYNAWIDKVDGTWQGDLPATLVFNNARKKRDFHKGEVDEPGLRKLIESHM
jgi:thiol-disulfide isomerase/thioredoxin